MLKKNRDDDLLQFVSSEDPKFLESQHKTQLELLIT